MMKRVLLKQDQAKISLTCEHATSFAERTRGLLGRNRLEANTGMIIEPCKQVHTLFMSFPIDVLFLSDDNEILAIQSLKPWRFSKLLVRARRVVELEFEKARALGFEEGQRLELIP